MRENEDFLRYYFDELSYLRDAGRVFAQENRKIAARLEMQQGESADPHVERLIESFAFLTARLQRQMHAEFPDLTGTLLDALYPQLTQPLPPMAVACFDVGATIKGLTEGFPIRKQTALFAQDPAGVTCRFRTCFDTVLWPVTVTEATIESGDQYGVGKAAAVLRIRLHGREDLLSNPEFLPSLRFYIDGPPELTGKLWELLFANTIDVLLAGPVEDKPVSLGVGALREVGFLPEEAVLPYPSNALPGYRLLQEYFNFPKKFLFFDVQNLDRRRCAVSGAASTDTLDILFLLDDLPRSKPNIHARNFRLGCTPVINLFQKTSEPIRLDHMQLEYRLIADIRRVATTEIHSILSVSGSANPAAGSQLYQPFFSFRQNGKDNAPQAFWKARRVAAEQDGLRGTDLYLSFVDQAFVPTAVSDQTVFAHTLCTNRWLASQMPDRALLNIEDATPVLQISCLGKPTTPLYPPLDGSALWRLVSSLSLNSASIGMEGDGLLALKEILRLYALRDRAAVEQEIDGISAMRTRKVLWRSSAEGWRGFRRGTEFTFTFDGNMYSGGSALMLAAVLRHFLGLYTAANTFTQVAACLQVRDGTWKRWAPMAGGREML
jgi:type VI secretion system protein ImpG